MGDAETIKIMAFALLLVGIPSIIILLYDRYDVKKEKAKFIDSGGDRCSVKVPVWVYRSQALFSGNMPDIGMWMFDCTCPVCGSHFYGSSREDSVCMCCMYDGTHN